MSMILEGVISSWDDEFNGVVTDSHGTRISIPGALIGEKIQYRIEHVSPHCARAWGRCEALLSPSPDRVIPVCPHAWPVAGMCAGCPLMHMSSSLQDRLKKQFTLDSLQNAGISYIRNLTLHSPSDLLHYRNRTDLIAAEIHGKFALGSYKPRSHEIVETKKCPILRTPLNQVIDFIVNTARKERISAAKTGVYLLQGDLRYVSLFANDSGKVLVDLICHSAKGDMPLWLNSFAQRLKAFAPVAGVSWSINDSVNNALRVAPAQLLWGEMRLPEHHGALESLFAASGFTQLNTAIATDIYRTAKEWISTAPRIVWDLYCGVGAFGRTLAPSQALYGAEFNRPAIETARTISAKDPFSTQFEVLDLDSQWPESWPAPDLILLDPPRKGLSPLVLRSLLKLHPSQILYMSCNPISFAQNVAALSPDYAIERIEAFDMMPQTRQVEVLALLRLNGTNA